MNGCIFFAVCGGMGGEREREATLVFSFFFHPFSVRVNV